MRELTDRTLAELKEYMAEIGEAPFRAAQLFKWVAKGADVGEMTNVPKALREKIAVTWPEVLHEQTSRTDGTRKLLVGFADGEAAECVFMRYEYGNTACISTQVGCRMGCRFCASGMDGLVRNLTAGEMIGEIRALERSAGEPVSHIVLMGTGEPMDNYENVARFLRIVHDEKGRNLSYRRGSNGSAPNFPR